MTDTDAIASTGGAETRQDAESKGAAKFGLHRSISPRSSPRSGTRSATRPLSGIVPTSGSEGNIIPVCREEARFNLFFSNIKVRPVLYQKTPEPDVRRRFLNGIRGPFRLSEMLERALNYFLDKDEFDDAAGQRSRF